METRMLQFVRNISDSKEELIDELKITKRRLDRILHMRFLDPIILKMILRGEQPKDWNTHLLSNCYTSDWREQKRYFKL
ncbi:MAG: hypothetical protein ACRCTJ_01170 [Brevinema sp.]